MGIEKRRYRRLETNLAARLKNLSEQGSDPVEVHIVNLGPEGAFAEADQTVPSQSQVSLTFRLDSYPMEINVIAKVLWQKKGENGAGMGMQFLHIPLFEKNIIIDYILRRYAEHMSEQGADGE